VSLKCRVSDDAEYGTCCSVFLEHALLKLVYARTLRKSTRLSVFLKPCMKTLNEILRIECDLMKRPIYIHTFFIY